MNQPSGYLLVSLFGLALNKNLPLSPACIIPSWINFRSKDALDCFRILSSCLSVLRRLFGKFKNVYVSEQKIAELDIKSGTWGAHLTAKRDRKWVTSQSERNKTRWGARKECKSHGTKANHRNDANTKPFAVYFSAWKFLCTSSRLVYFSLPSNRLFFLLPRFSLRCCKVILRKNNNKDKSSSISAPLRWIHRMPCY